MNSLPVRTVAPVMLVMPIVQGDSGLDLTTVTSAAITVVLPDGSTTSWPATIASASTTALRLEHTFQSGDLDVVGTYRLVPYLTVPAGSIPCSARQLVVVPLGE